jgi:hypothetical protein
MLEKLNDLMIGLEDLVKSRGDINLNRQTNCCAHPRRSQNLDHRLRRNCHLERIWRLIFCVQDSTERTSSPILPFKARRNVFSPAYKEQSNLKHYVSGIAHNLM